MLPVPKPLVPVVLIVIGVPATPSEVVPPAVAVVESVVKLARAVVTPTFFWMAVAPAVFRFKANPPLTVLASVMLPKPRPLVPVVLLASVVSLSSVTASLICWLLPAVPAVLIVIGVLAKPSEVVPPAVAVVESVVKLARAVVTPTFFWRAVAPAVFRFKANPPLTVLASVMLPKPRPLVPVVLLASVVSLSSVTASLICWLLPAVPAVLIVIGVLAKPSE